METRTGVLGLMSGHRLSWIFWSRLVLVVGPQARVGRRGLERVSGTTPLARFLFLENVVRVFAKRSQSCFEGVSLRPNSFQLLQDLAIP